MTHQDLACSARTFPVSFTPACALAVLATTTLVAPAGAQGGSQTGGPAGTAAPPTLWISTTADVNGGGVVPAVDDGELWRVRLGDSPRVQFAAGHWAAARAVAPKDVDALALRPGFPPGSAAALSFSTLGNVDGTLDGDVLGLAPGGGYQVLIAEAALAQALGVPGTALDIDGLAWDPGGRLYFSLQTDLTGSVLGDVANGDVLRLEADGSVTRQLTEADVAVALTAATGSTASVGDVQGLEWTAAGLWVLVQSPSSVDGGVLQTGASPMIVLDDVGAGLGGAELDALVLVPADADLGALVVEPAKATVGQPVAARMSGLAPGHLHLVVWSGTSGFSANAWLGGWGSWGFDPGDPWIAQQSLSGAWVLATADGSGEASLGFAMPDSVLADPSGYGGAGWTLQALDLADLTLLAPFRALY